jgi:NRAMP (natural resistance-associated macrophage protein)-like metal ion transporter
MNNRFLVILSVIGPGFIAGNAGNDAGGIATYSIVGAREGYGLLWALILITFALAVIQEMSSRMGVVTGKGFGDLVREQFGIRVTLAVMALFVFANLTVLIAEFAGIAASMELFGVHKHISVPISAFVVWLVVVKGNFKQVERFLIAISLIYLTYVFSGVMWFRTSGSIRTICCSLSPWWERRSPPTCSSICSRPLWTRGSASMSTGMPSSTSTPGPS